MNSPIDTARARLAAALLAGEDTAPHRLAIARLEANARVADERHAANTLATDAQRAAAVQNRAGVIASETQTRIDALLASHPVHASGDERHG